MLLVYLSEARDTRVVPRPSIIQSDVIISMYISHRGKGLILYAFRRVRAVSRMNAKETGNNTFYKEFDTLSREVENNHICIYIRRTYANFWQNIICLRSSSCLIRLHRVVYYFYAWRIWMVLELEGIGRRSHGKSEAAEKKRHFFTAMRGKNVEPFFDNSLIRKGPLTYNQRTCRTIRGSCHCPCLCRCRPLSTSAS